MKLKIIGVKHQGFLISLKRLTNAFVGNHEFVSNDASYTIRFVFIIYEGTIKVILKSGQFSLELTQEREEDLTFDKKYAMLCVYYQFMTKVTTKILPWGVLTGIRPNKLVHRYINKGFSKAEIKNRLMSKFLIQTDKAQLLMDIAYHQRTILPTFNELRKQISIYINIPFCQSRCSYCSFTSYNKNNKHVSVAEYLKCLIEEIKEISQFIKKTKLDITTIYVGGGTPTALDESELDLLLRNINHYLLCDTIKEYTLECGRPDTLNVEKFEIIKKYGVTRISINPQTFHDQTLKNVKRNHQSSDIIRIYNEARIKGFSNINMDLIIGLPGESISIIKDSLNQTIKLNPESITVHSLAYKKGAKLERKDEETGYTDLFDFIYQTLKSNGYIPYYIYRQKNSIGNLENVGYSKPNSESIYNIIMIEELQNIIGLGCGASSKFLNNEIVLNPKDLKSYTKSYKDYLHKKMQLLLQNIERERE